MIAAITINAPDWGWVVVLGSAAVLTAVVWLYRPQIAPLKSRWWWSLLVLRCFALTILALSLLKPTIARPAGPANRGVIAVLIDRSLSMSATDTTRSPSELVQLSAALGALPAAARSEGMIELRSGMFGLRSRVEQLDRAFGEVEYARVSGRNTRDAELRLTEARQRIEQHSRAMSQLAATTPAQSLADAISDIGNAPKRPVDDWARSTVERVANIIEQIDVLQNGADEELYRNNLVVRAACDALGKESRLQLAQRALHNATNLPRADASRRVTIFGFGSSVAGLDSATKWTADGTETNIDGAIRDARHAMAGQSVRALVVFSDGRQVASETSAAVSWPGVPIYAVQCAAPRVRDVALTTLDLPANAFVNEQVPVQIAARAQGESLPAELALNLSTESAPQAISTAALLAGEQLSMRFNQPGLAEVAATVAPIPGEATPLNNRLSRAIRVSSEPLRVALVAGRATRDAIALRESLQASNLFSVSERSTGSPTAPADSPEFRSSELIVLMDVAYGGLTVTEWDQVNRTVAEAGASLLLVVADASTASSYSVDPIVSSLMPWRGRTPPSTRSWPGEDPVFRVIPASNETAERLRLADSAERSRSIWQDLPGIYRFLSIPALKPGVRVLLVDQDSNQPILTEQAVGHGRVFMLGIDEVWRWRATLDPTQPGRFWTRLARFVAPRRYAVQSAGLWLDVTPLNPSPADSVNVRLRIASPEDEDRFDDRQSPPVLELVRGDTVAQQRTLPEPVEGEAAYHEVMLDPMSPGEYVLKVTWEQASASLPLRVRADTTAELANVSGDTEHLRRLASGGGNVIGLTELPALIQTLQTPGPTEPTTDELRLWDSPYLFILVLSCLGVEWALRRRAGLP